MSPKQLPVTSEWTFDDLVAFTKEIDIIAKDELRLDTYPNQIEIITAEQMIDAYSSSGLPVTYKHWSFGKQFISNMHRYKNGQMGLAYEIVINSDPCIAYLMEENTLPMQALVIAHACYGHNAFFKNNYLFKQRTQADGIIDHMVMARDKFNEFEQRYGQETVEAFLDHAHAIRNYGCNHYIHKTELTKTEKRAVETQKVTNDQAARNDLWDALIPKDEDKKDTKETCFPKSPDENMLKFFSKFAPNLEDWQREVLDILSYIQEYFYPQMQTQVANEGFATFTHRYIIQRLYEKGLVTTGFMQELLISHTNVTLQPEFDKSYYSGINPYALGYNMFEDIRRICTNPTEEDREFFPKLVDTDWVDAIKHAAFNYRDDTFIQQYLSPTVIRKMKLFSVVDDTEKSYVEIEAIHNDLGYDTIKEMAASQRHIHNLIPQIEITNVDTKGDRTLTLTHKVRNGVMLDEKSARNTLFHIQKIWDFNVRLISLDECGDEMNEWMIDSNWDE